MSVYAKENPEFLRVSLESLIKQSAKPQELILVKDGPLNAQLDHVIDKYNIEYPNFLKVIELPKNIGLGLALKKGMQHCSFEWVARCDSDDINHKDRFQRQLNYILENPNIDVLGTSISEFEKDVKHSTAMRVVPQRHVEIAKQAKWKNPMNHMSVFLRKSAVLSAGNYQHFPGFEDYHLWIRMIIKGYLFHNLQENLVYARIGNDMVGRRHGYNYLRHELDFINWVYKMRFISRPQKYKMSIIRSVARLLPKSFLKVAYKKLNRKN